MAHSYVLNLIGRHASGDRSSELLRQLDLLAWSDFHDAWEAPPGVVETPVQKVLRELRAWEPLAGLSDEDLLARLDENPMLHCEAILELSLSELVRWPNGPSHE